MNPKKFLKRHQFKIVAGVVIVGGAYVLHRRKLDEVITLSQAAVQDTMWSSFNEGTKYGLRLAKDIADGDVFALEDAKQYAFGAFDNAQDKAAWMHTTPAG